MRYFVERCTCSSILIDPLVIEVAKLVILCALFGMVFGSESISPLLSVVLDWIELPHLNRKLYNAIQCKRGRKGWMDGGGINKENDEMGRMDENDSWGLLWEILIVFLSLRLYHLYSCPFFTFSPLLIGPQYSLHYAVPLILLILIPNIYIMEGNEFERKYKQLNMLGKGNYGKVYKVKLNDGKEGKQAKYFVAKKMFLEGLSQDQIRSAFGEIEILEKINKEISTSEIPFVVTYKQFFRIENQLIIIMQYCESGDLSTFIKNLKKNNQRLNQKIIAFWFIQLLFGIKALHSKNILHRDLKSANIFLTKNYSLKIGDFGISKVLERSSAITCIGTPLYLSPEVCNNQPYGLSSDMWALGCILYEMCALKYPFQASNMIVLAKKIVMDDVAPLPSHYSKQLNDIVMKMFVKDNKKRITADQIMKTPYIMKAISDFVKEQGRLDQLAIPISNSEPVESKPVQQTTGEEEDTMRTIKSVVQRTGGNDTLEFSQSLTPKQRLRLKKQEETRRREQEIKEATRKQIAENSFAKQQKQRNLGQTGQFGKTENKVLEMKAQNQNKARSEIKYKVKEMEKMQTINITMISNTLQNLTIKANDHDDFEEVPLPGNSSYLPINEEKTIKKGSNVKVNQKTIKKSAIKKEEEIAQEIYEEEELEEYYDDDFEEYVEESEGEKQKKQENILAYFENELGGSTLSPSKREKVNNAYRPLGTSSIKDKIKHLEEQSEMLVGAKRFAELVKLFKEGKINLQKDKTKYNDKEKKVLYNIEEIVEYSLRE